MVKLIRLTSDDSSGIFDTTFKQDIIIKSGSQIALKSLSVGVDSKQITINGGNDDISYQLSTAGGIKNVKLTHDSYDNKTSDFLLNDMDLRMNASLDTSTLGFNKDIGVEIKNSIDKKTTKFQSDFNLVKLDEYFNDIVLNKGSVDVDTSGAVGSKNFKGPAGGDPAEGECFFYNNINICKGGGVFRLRRNIPAGATNPVGRYGIIGFMDVNPDTLTDKQPLDIANIIFGVVVNDITGIYEIINFGTISAADTGLLCADDDIIEIGISRGEIVARVYNAGDPKLLKTVAYGFNNLFPVVEIEKRSTEIFFDLVRYTPNPYIKNQTDFIPLGEEVEVGIPPPKQGGAAPTNHFLKFESSELSEYLGFKTNRIPANGFTSTNRFIVKADNIFQSNNLSDAFILEMLNIGLDSYDGELQSRVSYLSVIPKDDRENSIIYDAPYPIFIDINNYQPLTVRNIKCRLLNNDLSPVAMVGVGTIVILLKD
jgi:hypothetical protein